LRLPTSLERADRILKEEENHKYKAKMLNKKKKRFQIKNDVEKILSRASTQDQTFSVRPFRMNCLLNR